MILGDEWINRCVRGWGMNGCLRERQDGRMSAWVDVYQMDVQKNEWMGGSSIKVV
jgi:hypothetical protein